MKRYAFLKKRDIFVYAILMILVVVLFLIPFGSEQAQYFDVIADGSVIYTYDCLNKKGTVFGACSEYSEGDRIYLTVERDGMKNVIVFYDGTAQMVESSCPHKECIENFAPLKDEGVIVCLPNRLKVVGRRDGSITVPSGRLF